MKKLNCGCGNIPLEGYINMDKYYYPGCGSPNLNHKLAKSWKGEWIYGDVLDMNFKHNYFDKILFVHTLEHLSFEDGNRALQNISRILKPGGVVEIEVPDLTKACKLFLETDPFVLGGDNRVWWRKIGLFHGTTGVDGEGQFHLSNYTKNYLTKKMEEHGFINIEEILVGYGHGKPEPEYNFRLRGVRDDK
ncbi:MAG TPA: class I SAM-dependent methyltransferase [bacterium]|nr:class I SAM-dependent methyltransferase [bacterium]